MKTFNLSLLVSIFFLFGSNVFSQKKSLMTFNYYCEYNYIDSISSYGISDTIFVIGTIRTDEEKVLIENFGSDTLGFYITNYKADNLVVEGKKYLVTQFSGSGYVYQIIVFGPFNILYLDYDETINNYRRVFRFFDSSWGGSVSN